MIILFTRKYGKKIQGAFSNRKIPCFTVTKGNPTDVVEVKDIHEIHNRISLPGIDM